MNYEINDQFILKSTELSNYRSERHFSTVIDDLYNNNFLGNST